MKLSSIKVDGKAIESGAWVDSVPGLDGVRLKVRGINNLDYRRLEAKLIRDVPRDRRANGLDPEDADRIRVECMVKTVLLDWSGIEDDEGKPIAYSQDKATELLADPDFAVFANSVAYAGNIVGERKSDDQKADQGNSRRRSSGNSRGATAETS